MPRPKWPEEAGGGDRRPLVRRLTFYASASPALLLRHRSSRTNAHLPPPPPKIPQNPLSFLNVSRLLFSSNQTYICDLFCFHLITTTMRATSSVFASVATALLYASAANAYTVLAPTNSTGWTVGGPNTFSWTRVDTDPQNFTLVLDNQVSHPCSFAHSKNELTCSIRM